MEIKIDKTTRMVNLAKTVIGNDAENLQETLVFKFTNDFVDGQARLEYMIDGEKYYISLTKDGKSYTLPVKNVLTKEGKIQMQLVITEGTSEEDIPVFKSNVFYLYCNQSINAVDEAPSSYELWIEQANAKLNAMDEALTEVDNLDIDVSKTGNTATVEITQKDGTTKSVQITDGTNGTDGRDGVNGINGIDGISPIATISKSGNTATITITDKNGTTTATVSDGTNGTNGTNGRDGYVQYTAGENITIENNVISATGGGSGVPEEVVDGDYVGTIQNLGNQMSLQINYDNDSRINIIDFQDGLAHIGADASNNGETNTADMYLDATSSYGSLGTYTSDANATATISIDADDTNAYEQIQLSSGVVDISTNTYDGNGDAENQTSLYVDATSQTIYYTAPNGFKGQTPVSNDDIATKGYVDNSVSSINNMMPKLFDLAGNTYQASEPSPSSPQDVETVTDNNEIVISKGNKSQTYSVNLGSIELCKIGTYQDKFKYENGKWYLHKEVGKVVLDGSEGWQDYSNITNTGRALLLYSGLVKGSNILSNNFKQTTNFDEDEEALGIYPYGASLFYIKVNRSSLGSENVTGIKNWLSSHNTTVYYALATETDTEITDTTLINQLNAVHYAVTYGADTNVSQNNYEQPFEITYETIDNLSEYVNGTIEAYITTALEGVY